MHCLAISAFQELQQNKSVCVRSVWEERILAILFQYKNDDHLSPGKFIRLKSSWEDFWIDFVSVKQTPPLSHHRCICFTNIRGSFDFFILKIYVTTSQIFDAFPFKGQELEAIYPQRLQ